MKHIIIALDWTANTNHTGFFVAQANGFYKENGLEVTLRSPAEDNYAMTPAKLVLEDKAQFAIAPSESVIAYNTQKEVHLIATAAILQHDASAIVSLKNSGIQRMADLAGKKYASYDARFEDTIVAEMVKKDGGKEPHIKITPEKLGIWDTLLAGKADATWVFMPWEGIMAHHEGIELNSFSLDEFEIPYGYSPVLLAKNHYLEDNHEIAKNFHLATAKGFEWAAENPVDSAKILQKSAAPEDSKNLEFLIESQKAINTYYLDSNTNWGSMQADRWSDFTQWLLAHKLLSQEELLTLNTKKLFSNQYV